MATEVAAAELTHPALSSNNLLNDIEINMLASSHLGQKQITVSETLLDYCYPDTPPGGKDSEGPCPNGEGKDSMFQIPSGEGKTHYAGSGVFLTSGKNEGPTVPYSIYSGTVTDCLLARQPK